MAQKIINVDDITDATIAGEVFRMRLTIEFLDADLKTIRGTKINRDYEVGEYTAKTFTDFLKLEIGLGEFMRRFKNLVKIPTYAISVTGIGDDDSSAIRQWAKENGHEVSERGRVPAEIRNLYVAAMADQKDMEQSEAE